MKPILPAVLVFVGGCGPAVTDVAGKVTAGGKPVVYGTVVLIAANGLPFSGVIRPDGTFRVEAVPLGPAKVAVSSPPPPGLETGKPRERDASDDQGKVTAPVTPAPPEVLQNWFAIPDKYGEPGSSGLTADVRPGQPLDLDLK